jgi:hypothetical protein
MAGAMAVGEVLLERFFENFRSLYPDKFEAQMALSKAQYTLYPVLGVGEVFVTAFVWFENLEGFLIHQNQFLIAAKLTSLDGLDLVKVSPEEGDKSYKLLRTP